MNVATNLRSIDFYFDFISPWAYFAWQRIDELGCRVRPIPVPYPKLVNAWNARAIATIPPKREFIAKYSMRYAKRHMIPFTQPKYHPYKPYLSLRLAMPEVCGADNQTQMIDSLFKACWVDKIAMDSETELIDYLSKSGFDAVELIEKTKDQNIKKTLICHTEEAIERGVFGVPTFFIEDELFWGVDQFEDMQNFLNGKDPITDGDYRLTHSWGLDTETDAARNR